MPIQIHIRQKVLILRLGTIVLSIIIVILLGAANKVTESPEFCGGCHFEKPLYRTWQNSGHARGSNFYREGAGVTCIDCHVKPGLGGYVDGKLRGLGHISIQFFGIPNKPREPRLVKTQVSDENCLQCHAATPHRMYEMGESDIPLIDEDWIEANSSNVEAEELGLKLGLVMAHRTHMSLAEECATCHVRNRKQYNEMEINPVLAQLQDNPMNCVACHRDVTHRALHLAADSTKYYTFIAGDKMYIDVPSEKEICGQCHQNDRKCLWENGKDQFTFSIDSVDYCIKCHPGQSLF